MHERYAEFHLGRSKDAYLEENMQKVNPHDAAKFSVLLMPQEFALNIHSCKLLSKSPVCLSSQLM